MIEETKAKVILTSQRRINKSVEEFQEILVKRNFKGQLIGKLNDKTQIDSVPKAVEIKKWFEENGTPEKFLIIDDNSRLVEMEYDFIKNWVKTNYHTGFDENALLNALKIMDNE